MSEIVVFYANGLFSGQVTKVMGIAQNPRGEALASFILQAIALPGYICTVGFIERVGLRRLQLMGFLATSIIFFILAGCQSYLSKVLCSFDFYTSATQLLLVF